MGFLAQAPRFSRWARFASHHAARQLHVLRVVALNVRLSGRPGAGQFHAGFTGQPCGHTNWLWNSRMVLAGLPSPCRGCPGRQFILSGEATATRDVRDGEDRRCGSPTTSHGELVHWSRTRRAASVILGGHLRRDRPVLRERSVLEQTWRNPIPCRCTGLFETLAGADDASGDQDLKGGAVSYWWTQDSRYNVHPLRGANGLEVHVPRRARWTHWWN